MTCKSHFFHKQLFIQKVVEISEYKSTTMHRTSYSQVLQHKLSQSRTSILRIPSPGSVWNHSQEEQAVSPYKTRSLWCLKLQVVIYYTFLSSLFLHSLNNFFFLGTAINSRPSNCCHFPSKGSSAFYGDDTSWPIIIQKNKHSKNCECCHHHSLFKGHNVNVKGDSNKTKLTTKQQILA